MIDHIRSETCWSDF